MKKNRYTDYAIAAFRDYAEYSAHTDLEEDEARLADVKAVEETLRQLENQNKQYIISAVKFVYMQGLHEKFTAQVISKRVLSFASQNYVHCRTVYKWLNQANRIFAYHRKLCDGSEMGNCRR